MALGVTVAAMLAGGVLAGCGSNSKDIGSTVEKQIEKGKEESAEVMEEVNKQIEEATP